MNIAILCPGPSSAGFDPDAVGDRPICTVNRGALICPDRVKIVAFTDPVEKQNYLEVLADRFVTVWTRADQLEEGRARYPRWMWEDMQGARWVVVLAMIQRLRFLQLSTMVQTIGRAIMAGYSDIEVWHADLMGKEGIGIGPREERTPEWYGIRWDHERDTLAAMMRYARKVGVKVRRRGHRALRRVRV